VKNVVFWDINPQVVLHWKHIMSALQSRASRLLGYKNPIRTSQETHYVSAREPS
jgi:hypothetical protein